MRKKKEIVLSRIKKKVRELDPDAEIILYGSRARGDQREDSDWDLLILIKGSSDIEVERKFRHKLYDLELELGEAFSTFVYNKEEWKNKYSITPLYHNIKKEGVII